MSNNRKHHAGHLLALISLLLFVVTFSHKIVHAQVSKPVDYKITTLFGGLNGDGLNATMVGTYSPLHIAISPNGNVYYTDSGNNQIRYVGTDGNSHVLAGYPTYQTDSSIKMGLYLANDTISTPYGISLTMNGDVIFTETTGIVRRVFYNSTIGAFNMLTIAGGGNSLASNVSALSARLNNPRCVVVASNDDIYICDSNNNMIRKIVNDTIYTVAGTGVYGNSADGSIAANSNIGQPTALAFHPLTGELYFVQFDGAIKYITNNGSLYLFRSLSANVYGLAFASNGDLYASINSNNRIYVIKGGGVITFASIAGSAQFGGDGGLAYNAFLRFPTGITIYGNNLYVADTSNNRIRKIDLTSTVISTIAGDGSTRYTGSKTGTRSTMNLDSPQSTFYNSQTDELLITDTGNYRVLRLNSLTNINTSLIETIAGTGVVVQADSDGKLGNQTGLYTPYSVVQSETSGDVFIGTYNRVLQLSKSTQKISTIAGTAVTLSGDNYLAIYAQLNRPAGIDISPSGEIYFVDQYNYVVRKIDNSGIITTIVGTGTSGYQDGDATSAQFSFPTGLVYLPNGDLLISDTHGQRIRKYIASTRQVTSIAGNGVFGFAGDGGLAKSATIYQPSGMWYNSTSGDIIFADTANGRIRKITNSTGIISTIAGTGTRTYNGDGLSSLLTNMSPFGVTVHPISGEIYYTDNLNYLVRRIDATGLVYTVIGVPSSTTFSTSGPVDLVGLNVISFMTFSGNGDLYIACTTQNVIKKMDYGTNIVYNVAGTGAGNMFIDTGNATTTTINNPTGVAVNTNTGEVFFTDSIFSRVRKISSKAVKTIAGGNGDNGLAVNANMGRVLSLALTDTDLYLSDMVNYRIRKVSFSSGIITSIVGTYYYLFNGDYLANQTNINGVNDIRVRNNELIFADTSNFKVRKTSISGIGQVSTIAGAGTFINTLLDNVKATSAYLKYPGSVALLPNGEMIITENDGHIIRKVDLNGYISLIAGKFNQPGYNGDSSDSKNALLYGPKGLSVLNDGRIIFIETGNNRVRMLTPYCKDEMYYMTQSSQGIVCNMTSCNGIYYTDSKVCSGNGACKSLNNCTCSAGYSGSDCSIADICSLLSNSYICSSSSLNTTQTTVTKVSNITQLNSFVIQFSSTASVTASLSSTLSQYLQNIIKNDTVSVVSSLSATKTVDTEIVSPVISIALFKSSSNLEIPVQSLSQPISLYFNKLNVTVSNIETLNITCMYFDESEKQWKSDGVESEITEMILHNLPDGNMTITISLTCKTYHLTSFGIIDQNYKKANSKTNDGTIVLQDYTVLIAAIVGGVGGCCVLAVVLTILIVVICMLVRKRKK